MGRIRTVKPEFFKHEALFDAEVRSKLPLRVAFAGLWTVADREGRFQWMPRFLKSEVLPYDEVDFALVLAALEAGDFVRRYEVDGKSYGFIPGFLRHQQPNAREKRTVLPPPPSVEGYAVEAASQVHADARTCAPTQRTCAGAEGTMASQPPPDGPEPPPSAHLELAGTIDATRASPPLPDARARTCIPAHARGEREREREREQEAAAAARARPHGREVGGRRGDAESSRELVESRIAEALANQKPWAGATTTTDDEPAERKVESLLNYVAELVEGTPHAGYRSVFEAWITAEGKPLSLCRQAIYEAVEDRLSQRPPGTRPPQSSISAAFLRSVMRRLQRQEVERVDGIRSDRPDRGGSASTARPIDPEGHAARLARARAEGHFQRPRAGGADA